MAEPTREHTYALRLTWPGERDCEDDYLVIDEEGERIARIYFSTGTYPPSWRVHIGALALPIWDAQFNGRAGSLEAAKALVKELWPRFRAHWTDEDYEKARHAMRVNEERERNSPARKRWLMEQEQAARQKSRRARS